MQEIGHRCGIGDTYGFSIFILRHGQLVSLRGAGGGGLHVMDVISKMDAAAAAKGQKEDTDLNILQGLSFRKESVLLARLLGGGGGGARWVGLR